MNYRWIKVLFASVLLVVLAGALEAEDWPRFCGPTGQHLFCIGELKPGLPRNDSIDAVDAR